MNIKIIRKIILHFTFEIFSQIFHKLYKKNQLELICPSHKMLHCIALIFYNLLLLVSI